MNKTELVEALTSYFDGNRTEALRALNAVVHAVSSATAAGERVTITGFGVFERLERPARTVRNPRTGERLDVPATAVPRFRAGTELKAYASGQRAVPEFVVGSMPRRTAAAARVEAPRPAGEPAATPQPAVEIDEVKTDKVKPDKAKPDKAKTDKAKTDKKDSSATKAERKKDAKKMDAAKDVAQKSGKKGKGTKK